MESKIMNHSENPPGESIVSWLPPKVAKAIAKAADKSNMSLLTWTWDGKVNKWYVNGERVKT